MSLQELIITGRAMRAQDKGLMAMDESTPICNKRFKKAGIPHTGETRRYYREMIVTTPELGGFIIEARLLISPPARSILQ